ncbi:MAG: glutamate formimidoyltransferase [Eubacteriales bacterium]|nr:glutamate formimidoyltransferase [Eubacteriales bacterium]MCI6979258.1 glutamate formimidoyltransferase [Clostridiales bacterium]MDD6721064.1 glutamate formimidoyltransferase [Clostridiales bacterium]MDY5693546.1 glutamate formimidoyltransferase [Eubacteriales bacterium]HZK46266.1 glutamate formimidoyltransferase [Clostridia bacterium]
MERIVECVPNISEGRRKEVVEAVVNEVRSTANVTLLDYSSDESHNRSVITFIGEPESVVEAAVKLAKKAAELIDLTRHTGEHPRMGAVDVIPLIPIRGISKEETVELSKKLAERVCEEAGMPVFLYEESASAPNRVNLASIRKGQFEGMAQKVLEPEWEPDFGGRRINPTAGVAAVGCRMPLVAFNINLSTDDVSIASRIAKIIRRSSGGLDCVKALGIMLEERNIAQVSINMTDFTRTPLYRVLEMVRFEAARYGVHVIGTEIIGLTPMRALVDCAEYYLQIENFSADKQVLENYIQ